MSCKGFKLVPVDYGCTFGALQHGKGTSLVMDFELVPVGSVSTFGALQYGTGTSLAMGCNYRKYYRYNTLTEDEQLELFVVCEALKPSLLINKAIFQDDEMCGYDDNKFFKLNVVRHDLLVSEAIIIGGKRCAVKKIMAFKKQWLDWCYTIPLQQLARTVAGRLEQQRRAEEQRRQQQRANNPLCLVM